MRTIIDFHSHTIASGHYASDTITAMAEEAKKRGLRYLCVTDHAPAMPGAASESYFRNLKYADKKLYGINMTYGVELNVLNGNGEVDLPDDVIRSLDFSIASLHKDVLRPSSERENATALINAAKNPYVDIIGHPDDPTFPIDFVYLVDAAKEMDVVLELNAQGTASFGYRKKNPEGVRRMLERCEAKGAFVSLGSDSHGKDRLADFDECYALLDELRFPEQLIINSDPEAFLSSRAAKRGRRR